MSRSVRNPVPASVPILDRLDRADSGLVLAASTYDRLARPTRPIALLPLLESCNTSPYLHLN